MSQYGSPLTHRPGRTTSPAYSHVVHKDDYNRYETARHAAAKQSEHQKSEESRFQAFGDRPGSGVEMFTHHWQGGEIITDPSQLPKSLKPRRLYYSPIGDGTVAADGIELKRRPADLSPRVTITQMTHVDRGQKGHDGLNVYEKTWTNAAGSRPGSEAGYGNELGGAGSGRGSRMDALSPAVADSHGKGTFGSHSEPGPPSGYSPTLGVGRYGGGQTPFSHGTAAGSEDACTGQQGTARDDPYSKSNSFGHPYGFNGTLGPSNDGRVSVASSMFSDPSYRFDAKTGYLITNPRELIHQYATTTPVAVMENNDNTSTTTTVSKHNMSRKMEVTTEERFSPYVPYKSVNIVQSPNKFTQQLRDETMTRTQREANTHVVPLNQHGSHAQQRTKEIQMKTQDARRSHDEIDNLTQQLVQGLHTFSRL